MAAFAGMLLGMSQAMEQEHRENLDQELTKRKALMEMFLKDAHDPNAKPWHQQDAIRRLGILIQTAPGKKLPSEVENLKTYGQRPQQVDQPRQQPQGPTSVPAPGPPADLPGTAPGGRAPGLLQGGANQIPMPPTPGFMGPEQGIPPPPPASAVLPPPQIPMTPPPAPPTYGGPAMESGRYSLPEAEAIQGDAEVAKARAMIPVEAQRQEAIIRAGKVAAYKAFKEMGMSDDQAQYAASGMAKVMVPKPVQVLLEDGTTVSASRSFDPATGDYIYTHEGRPLKIVREVGLAIQPHTTVEVKSGVAVGVKRADGSMIPFGDPRLTADEAKMLADARAGSTTERSTSSSGPGGFTSTTTVTKKKAGANSAAPPPPPGSAKPKESGTPSTEERNLEYTRRRAEASTEGRLGATARKDYEDAVTRYNVMKDAVAKSASDPTGASDMVLLANHMGMTVGDVKGMRTGTELIKSHLQARGLPDAFAVFIDRVNSGKQLSPSQRQSFLELAKVKMEQAKRKYEALSGRTAEATSDEGPPLSALTEGHNTTFANGQIWTLRNGQRVRVK